MGRGGLRAWLKSGAARGALALGAVGLGALASAPAQACFFISGGSVQFNPNLSPPCGTGFFNDFASAQAALNALSSGGGSSSSPSTTPSTSPTTSTSAASTSATTPITADNVRQIMGSTLLNDSGAGLLNVPVDIHFMASPKLAVGAQTGVTGPLDGFGDSFLIPLGGPGPGPDAATTFWAGQRFYRRRDVHIQDFFHFDSGSGLPGQQFSTPDTGTGKYAKYRLDESAPPTPQDRVFFGHSYFGTPLPTVGTGAAAASYESNSGDSEITIRFDGVADNGLQYGARVEIPITRPEQPSQQQPSSGSLDELGKFAMILFTDEAPAPAGAMENRRLGYQAIFSEIETFERSVRRAGGGDAPFNAATAEALLEEAGWRRDGDQAPGPAASQRLSGGALFLGDLPPGARVVFRSDGVSDNGLHYGVSLDFGDLSGGEASGAAPPYVAFGPLGDGVNAEGLRYAVDLAAAARDVSQACQRAGADCGALKQLDMSVDEKRRVTVAAGQEAAPATPGGAPSLVLSDFGFAPGGPVQGTATLFQAPPQPAGLPPVRLPVAQVDGAGGDLEEGQRQLIESLWRRLREPTFSPSTGAGGVRRSRAQDDLIVLPRGAGGRNAFVYLSDASLGTDYRVSKDSPVSLTLDVFDIFAFDPPAAATPAEIQPNGSAASMLFGESSAGGAGVTSNGVQFSASLQPSVVVPAQPKGTLTGQPLGSLGGGPSGDFERDAARFFLDAFIADPAGGRGSANAGAAPPAQSAPAPAAQPGRASGQVRVGARDGVRLAPTQPGQLRMNLVGQGVVPDGPTYGVRISADPAQPPARPGATGILGQTSMSIGDSVVSANFDVDVRGAERLAEQACGGVGLDCGGAVRNVVFSFNSPGAAPVVDLAVGLDAQGRPAPRAAEPGGILILTLASNGGGPQASAKLFQAAPDQAGGAGILLVDVVPPVAVGPGVSLQEASAQAMAGALRSVAAEGGRLALSQPEPGGILLPATVSLPTPALR